MQREQFQSATKRTAKHKRHPLLVVLLLLGLPVAVFFLFDRLCGQTIKEFAQNQAKYIAVTAINTSINEELQQNPVSYEQLFHVNADEQGKVSSITVNPGQANDISSRLTLAANKALVERFPQKVRVPVGTVLGINLLSGRGPSLTFHIVPSSYVESSFLSGLEGAGLNQTMHSVILRMSVTVECFCGSYHTRQQVTSDMILTQTVIVGDVPSYFGGYPSG